MSSPSGYLQATPQSIDTWGAGQGLGCLASSVLEKIEIYLKIGKKHCIKSSKQSNLGHSRYMR